VFIVLSGIIALVLILSQLNSVQYQMYILSGEKWGIVGDFGVNVCPSRATSDAKINFRTRNYKIL